MLLGNRKKQEEEQNWCIVLTPLRNEIDKKKIARKISEVFSLSLDEAADLVSNTPIILLDNLTRAIASQVKDYFRHEGAELVLTNDIFYKRKCYRTVWPEAPNLSFLTNESDSREKPAVQPGKALGAAEALQELRSLQPRGAGASHEAASESADIQNAPSREKKQLLEELEMWRRECSQRRGEVERLQASLEKLKDQRAPSDSSASVPAEGRLQEKERQLKDQQALIKSLQEKYEALREEYRQARTFFEEKVSSSTRDSQDAKGKLKSLEDKARALHEKNQILEAGLQKAQADLKQAQGRESEEGKGTIRQQEAVNALDAERKKTQRLEEELQRLKQRESFLTASLEEQRSVQTSLKSSAAEAERIQAARTSLEQQIQSLTEKNASLELRLQEESQRFKMQEAAVQKALTETRERRDLFEIRLLDAEKELQASTRKINELTDALKRAVDEKQQVSVNLDERKRLDDQVRAQNDLLIRKYNAMIVQYDEDKLLLIKSEQRVRDLEAELQKLTAVVEEGVRRINSAESCSRELEASLRASQADLEAFRRASEDRISELAEKNRLLDVAALERESLKRAFQESRQRAEAAESRISELLAVKGQVEETSARLEHMLSEKTKQAESKDREIDGLRRQIKEINFQMEQRETLLKRNQIMAQLAEKEDKLKKLVDDQNRMETEIRQREEAMRHILAQQEALEKEIVEGKQAQRHLLEQVKKDKPAVPARSVKSDLPPALSPAAPKKETPAHD